MKHGPGATNLWAEGEQQVSISLGQPGLSFRYVETLGETEAGYLADNAHLNYPYGIGAVGDSIWIGEFWGNRILKYAQNGDFLKSFGRAGFPEDYTDTSFWEISDVAEDADGNVWVLQNDWIVKLDDKGKKLMTLGRQWSEGTDNSHFIDPTGIAFDSQGDIYVSDGGPWWEARHGNHRIQIFQPDGAYLATIGQTGVCGSGSNQLCGPRHLAIQDGKLYVADAGNNRIQIFDISAPASPAYLATIDGLNQPSGVAVDDAYIYVADTINNQVQIFDRTSLTHITTIGSGWGDDNDHFKHPSDVAIDASGNLYVADFVNIRVQQFTRSGSSWTYARTYGVTGVPYLTDSSHYNQPSGVAVAKDGSIYLTEEYGHRLLKLKADGTLLWQVGAAGIKGNWDAGNDRLNNPADVAIDSHEHVYVADRWHQRVQIYDKDGSYVATIGNLNCPGGVDIGPADRIYVADTCDFAVRIYDDHRNLIKTLGVSGQWGNDNAHFGAPEDVVVDSRGMIYVADEGNSRIQVFDARYEYVRTLGETGVRRGDFGHFQGPGNLAVDRLNRLYVADRWNHRIQVFDPSGAYLTTIGGTGGGGGSGEFRGPNGVAVDAWGDLYVADQLNHRIQKFTPGASGWAQMNLNGFGDPKTNVSSLTVFNDRLYAGAYKLAGHGAQIWRMDAPGQWTGVMTNGFGKGYDVGVDDLLAFKDKLYAGVWNSTPHPPYTDTGGEIWRSSDGEAWEEVMSGGFGDRYNGEIFSLAVFDGRLFAATWSYTSAHGAEIWRSATGDAGDWTRVVDNGLGEAANSAVLDMIPVNGHLYASTYNWDKPARISHGADIWRTADGEHWEKVMTGGFGDANNYAISRMAVFEGSLYASTSNWDAQQHRFGSSQIWRCPLSSGCDENSDWTEIVSNGFGDSGNNRINVFATDHMLYAVTANRRTGVQVWRSASGDAGDWQQMIADGFGDANNGATYWGHAIAAYQGNLFIGTENRANGGEVWQHLPLRLFLPTMLH